MFYTEVHPEENEAEEADEEDSDSSQQAVRDVLDTHLEAAACLYFSFSPTYWLVTYRVFPSTNCILARNGFMVDLQVVELERKNFYSNTDQHLGMELSLSAKVEILWVTLVCRFGKSHWLYVQIDSRSIVFFVIPGARTKYIIAIFGPDKNGEELNITW